MRKTKVIVAMLVIVCMMFACLPFKAFANDPDYFYITFTTTADHLITASNNPGEFMIQGQRVNIMESTEPHDGAGVVTVADDGLSASVKIPKTKTVIVNCSTDSKFSLFESGNFLDYNKAFNEDTQIAVQDYQDPPPPQPGEGGQPAANTIAKVTVTGGAGGYNETHYNPQTGEEEQEYVPYTKSYRDALVMINNAGVDIPWDGELPEVFTIDELGYNYHADDYKDTENEGKVKIALGARFIWKMVGKVTINNQEFTVSDFINYNDRDSWLDHYDGQCVGFEVYVDKADQYDIVMNLEPVDNDSCFIGNFLWTGDSIEEFETDPAGNPIIDDQTGEPRVNDNYIGHSKLKVVKIIYERSGETRTIDFTKQADIDKYSLGEREVGPGEYYQEFGDGDFEYGYITKRDNKTVDFDAGSLVVPDGAMVTMQIIPDYGYQVTSFGINGSDIITGDNISEFSFEIRKGNFHLGAKVTKVDNKVKSANGGILGGSIEVADGEIDSGSFMLSVSDSELSSEKEAEFKENIPEGYTLDGVADISLAQVFYKGSEDDVWAVDKDELNTEAEIKLLLAEDMGFNKDNSKIIHNVHDGDEFEEVPFEYNEDSRELSFGAKTFSNYAIVVKTPTETKEVETVSPTTTEETTEETVTDEEDNPQTGDNIIKFAAIFAVALLGLVVIIEMKNKKNKYENKH